MYVAPVGIFGLIAGRIGEAKGFAGFWPELVAVGKYSATVLLGLGLHAVVVLPLYCCYSSDVGILSITSRAWRQPY